MSILDGYRSGYVWGLWFVAPFLGEDVVYSSIAAEAACKALQGKSTRGPNHPFTITIKVKFNSFLRQSNAATKLPSSRNAQEFAG